MVQTIKYKIIEEAVSAPVVFSLGVAIKLQRLYCIQPKHSILGPYVLKTGILLVFPKGYHGRINLGKAMPPGIQLLPGSEIIQSGEEVLLQCENTNRYSNTFLDTDKYYFYVTLEPDADYKVTKMR